MTAGAGFRLTEVGGGAGGSRTFPRVFGSVDAALTAAERMLDALESRPWRRPFRVDITDAWTNEPVARVQANVERDPDVCVACGQLNVPFAALDLPAAGGMGSVGADAGAGAAAGLPADAPTEPQR